MEFPWAYIAIDHTSAWKADMKIKLTHKSNFFKRVDSIFGKYRYLSQKNIIYVNILHA